MAGEGGAGKRGGGQVFISQPSLELAVLLGRGQGAAGLHQPRWLLDGRPRNTCHDPGLKQLRPR